MKYNFWVGPTNCVIDISKNLICHIDLDVIEFLLYYVNNSEDGSNKISDVISW